MNASRQMLAYAFPPGCDFQGQLVGALERIESGGTVRVLDALFVAREPESGELFAVRLGTGGALGSIARLLSFRLEDRVRRSETERALAGSAGPLAQSWAAKLEPGAAVAALVVEHAWMLALDEAVDRMGGHALASGSVEASEIYEGWEELTGSSA